MGLQARAIDEIICLARIYRKRGLFDLAIRVLQGAIAGSAEEDLDLALCFYNLAAAYEDEGNYFAAQTFYKDAVAVWEKLNPADSLSALWYSDALKKLQELSDRTGGGGEAPGSSPDPLARQLLPNPAQCAVE